MATDNKLMVRLRSPSILSKVEGLTRLLEGDEEEETEDKEVGLGQDDEDEDETKEEPDKDEDGDDIY